MAFWRVMEEIKKIGEMFRTKREEMHLSLKEVENATSIRQMYLQAIEEGKISQFLSAVYSMGFIKQYASFLGYDAEKLVRENPSAFKMRMEKQEFAYGIGTLEKRGGGSGAHHPRWRPNLLWGLASMFVILFIWYIAKFFKIL